MARRRHTFQRSLAVLAGLALLFVAQRAGWLPEGGRDVSPAASSSTGAAGTGAEAADPDAGAREIQRLFREQRSGIMVEGRGEVERLLPDDLEGSPHQRFILRLATGDTVLVAHNIALAPRLPLGEGDDVAFFGQYEWNERGGLLHWTHHDPEGRHPGGWLRHAGELYE